MLKFLIVPFVALSLGSCASFNDDLKDAIDKGEKVTDEAAKGLARVQDVICLAGNTAIAIVFGRVNKHSKYNVTYLCEKKPVETE